jgi:protein-S-isoprenylcysteine O-methyltransferase Ste14
MNKEFKAFVGIVSAAPILFLIGLVLSFLLYTQFRTPLVKGFDAISILTALGAGMILIGTVLAFSAQAISRKVTSPDFKATTEGLMQGPYKYSRHPGSLSLIIMYVGFVFVVNSLVMLMMVVLLVAMMSFYFVPLEERVISGLAPEAYAEYKKRVRMWL